MRERERERDLPSGDPGRSPMRRISSDSPLSLRSNTEGRDLDLELHNQLGSAQNLTALLGITAGLLTFPVVLKMVF